MKLRPNAGWTPSSGKKSAVSQGLRQFKADVASADHDEVTRQTVEIERLDMAHRIRSGQPGNVGHRRARTKRQEDTFANDPSRAAVLQSDFNRSRSDEAAFAHHQLCTARRETFSVHLM